MGFEKMSFPFKDNFVKFSYMDRIAYADVGEGGSGSAPLSTRWRWAETTGTELEVGRLDRCARYRFRIAAVTARGTEGKVMWTDKAFFFF